MVLEKLALVGGASNFREGILWTRRNTKSNGTCSAAHRQPPPCIQPLPHQSERRAATVSRAGSTIDWVVDKGVAILGIRSCTKKSPSSAGICSRDGAPGVVAQFTESAKTKGETILSPNPREEAHPNERAHDGYRRRHQAQEGVHRRFQPGK